ncbi:hypothetical protein Tco_1193542 [Tanacetum coccineum]
MGRGTWYYSLGVSSIVDAFVRSELWEASVLLGRKKDDRGVTEGREDVREVFQQCRSRAKRKLSKCGRNQMGNEPILAFPEGPDDFVVYYDARSKDLEAGLEKREGDCWLTNRWLSMKKVIASCGSKYLAYWEVEVEYQGSSGLLLQPELPEYKWERITKDIVVKLPSVIILWAVTGDVELNGSNLVQETTNKIVVMEGRRSHLGESDILDLLVYVIDGEDLEDVGITVNRSDGDVSEEDECTNTERHDDYDALNLFRLLLKSIDDHVLADTLWDYGLSESHSRNGPVSSPWSQVYILHESRNVSKDAYSKVSKLSTMCEKVNPNLERSSKALENAFWLLSQKLAEED